MTHLRCLWDCYRECRHRELKGIPRAELLAYLAEVASTLDELHQEHRCQHLDIKPHCICLVDGHARIVVLGGQIGVEEVHSWESEDPVVELRLEISQRQFEEIKRQFEEINTHLPQELLDEVRRSEYQTLVSYQTATWLDEAVKQHCREENSLAGGVTPVYAAPETFDGEVSLNCDQYSLAVVYQEMLTGERPYSGTNIHQIVMAHMNGKPDLSALPEADRSVIGRALSQRWQDRYPNCGDFVRALREAQ